MSTTTLKSVKVFNSDMDFSLEKNIYGDVPKLINSSAVKNRLYNKLFLSADEIPFDDDERPDVRDVIHGEMDDMSKVFIADIVKNCVTLDDNANIQNITVDQNDAINGYVVSAQVEILYDNAGGVVETLGFTVTNN